ncbi:hypothetical protein BCR34DRAFT_384640 [Clohesyomyces aquaticus]|uniref:Uncharacterized protein n=1 Tax=Clohesyomyces aquaticus TaxID=1231657 RepID=A0A1Y1ZFF8_9PLEO|nr:hypothetical protein BCR34DRAFT_384640 [Clohesyomyces aquaticus]
MRDWERHPASPGSFDGAHGRGCLGRFALSFLRDRAYFTRISIEKSQMNNTETSCKSTAVPCLYNSHPHIFISPSTNTVFVLHNHRSPSTQPKSCFAIPSQHRSPPKGIFLNHSLHLSLCRQSSLCSACRFQQSRHVCCLTSTRTIESAHFQASSATSFPPKRVTSFDTSYLFRISELCGHRIVASRRHITLSSNTCGRRRKTRKIDYLNCERGYRKWNCGS